MHSQSTFLRSGILRSRLFALATLWLCALVVGAGCGASSPPRLKSADAQSLPQRSEVLPDDGQALIPVYADDPASGNPDAPATLVVFSDFECPFCAMHARSVDSLRDAFGESELRIVFKQMPLDMHQHARPAAEAAHAVFLVGGMRAYEKYAALLFQHQSSLGDDRYRELAALVGVQLEDFEKVLASGEPKRKVDKDRALAEKLGVQGTPESFLNGLRIGGVIPSRGFEPILKAEIARVETTRKSSGKPYTYRLALEANRGKSLGGDDDQEEPPRWKVPLGKSPSLGSTGAPVTLVVFSDFESTECRAFAEKLQRLMGQVDKDLRVVFKNRPLASHRRAEAAAQLAMHAYATGGNAAFWKVHDRLFSVGKPLDDSTLLEIARGAGLDVEKAKQAIIKEEQKARIASDENLADDLDVFEVPAVFVNGRRLAGALSPTELARVFGEELELAHALIEKGTPAAVVYDTLQSQARDASVPRAIRIAPARAAPSRGPATAKVTIEEFADFQCPYCARARKVVSSIEKAYPGRVRVVWRHFPLRMHRFAQIAAEAAMEAKKQRGPNGFWALHDKFFERTESGQSIDFDTIMADARAVGLDEKALERALDSGAHAAAVGRDRDEAVRAGFSGAPTFVVGGYVVEGGASEAKLKKWVDYVLEHGAARFQTDEHAEAPTVLADGKLVKRDVKVGTGRELPRRAHIKVHYELKLDNGEKVDSSRDRGQPIAIELGKHQVIEGWERGLVGMKEGGVRTLDVPPALGYGARGRPPKVPGNATLHFEIELIQVSDPKG